MEGRCEEVEVEAEEVMEEGKSKAGSEGKNPKRGQRKKMLDEGEF